MKRLLVLAFVVALVGGVASAQQHGVTDTEVVIGTWGPQSGPAAAWGTVATAIDAYFRYINEDRKSVV